MSVDPSGNGTYDLELDCLAVDVDSTNLKVNTYRTEVAFRVGVFGKPQKQTRLNPRTLSLSGAPVAWAAYLSYSRITDEEEFKEIIVVVGHL